MLQDNIARLDGSLQELLGHNPLRTAWDLFRTIDENLSMQVPYSAGPPTPESIRHCFFRQEPGTLNQVYCC